MRWLLHDAVLKDRMAEMLDLLAARGDEAVVLSGRHPTIPERDVPTIGLVTIQVARHIHANPQHFRPGVFWHPTAYAQTSWAPFFGHLMLNDDMVWLPFAEVVRRGAATWQRLFGGEALFLRPDAGHKAFVGQTLPFDGFAEAVHALDATSGVTSTTLVGICRPKPIDAAMEWRFWLGEGGVATSSPYSWEEDAALVAAPPEVLALADEMAAWCADEMHWTPDRLFVADFCLSAGRPRLVELNAASCSGIYRADLGALTAAIAAAVEAELALT